MQMKSVLQIVFCLLTSSIIIVDIPVQALTAKNFIYIVQNQNISELPDLSRAVISLEDLPPGFKETENSISKRKVKLSFLRENNISLQFILSQTSLLSDRFEEVRLKLTQAHWQQLREHLKQCFYKVNNDGSLEKEFGTHFLVLESRELTIPNDVGNISLGQSSLVKISAAPFRMDTVMFIRGRVMAYVVVLYLEDDVDAVPIIDLARKLDYRIQQHLQ
jgi:hypothetical protein